MGFGAPLALLLLTAVSLPWLVHRMRQRDLPTVQLPTIALLQRAMAVTQRRRALEDLLLMLTRMAMICVLALALAAPYWWAAAAFGGGQPMSLALVIDDSMSMQRSPSTGVGGGTLIEQAIERAREVISGLPSGSQVALIAAGRPPRTLASLGDPGAALTALNALAISPARGTEIGHAIQLADSTLSAAAHAQRQVLVLSDFAGAARPSSNAGAVDVRYERIGDTAPINNLAIAAVKATRDQAGPGALTLHVDVAAMPAITSQRSITIEVHNDSAAVTQLSAPIRAGHARIDVPLSAEQARDRDFMHVRVADDDALAIDNQRAVLLQDSRDRRVLLVNGDPRPTHSSDELHFLSRALPLAPRETTQLSFVVTDAVGLSQAALDAVDLIWLANVDAPDNATSARLIEFVRGGGSLMISAGVRVQAAAYNAQLGALLPGRIEGSEARTPIELDTSKAGIDPWGIAIESVGHVSTRQRLIVQASRADDVALRYSDGTPALLRHHVGRGRVALWTTTIDGDWTDLPFVPGFVALTTSLVQALAPHAPTSQVIEPGTQQRVAINSSREATLIDPQARRHALRIEGRHAWVAAEHTLLPGAYAVEVVDDNGITRHLPRAAFVVAPPVDESELSANPLPDNAATEAASAPTRVRQPFDLWLFACVLPLFLVEAFLRSRHRASTTRSL